MKIRSVLSLPILILLAFLFISWGGTGHRMISLRAALSFNQEMDQFQVWADYLSNHASDPDYRKSSDSDEGPKHYIDLDNYSEFNETGKIAMSYNEVVVIHGEQFVIQQGTLPWATLTTIDSLTSCFLRNDWKKAAFFAADLGHYVADGHMPLHITKNYNGQYTGNTGIHSRYESGMINAYENSISYTGDPAVFIENPTDYIFNYLYHNYTYVDSVLLADDYAQQVAGNSSSGLYTETLWGKTEGITTKLFSEASYAFANLIYTSWVNGGKPVMNATNVSDITNYSDHVLQVFYHTGENPSLKITYNIPVDTTVTISILDVSGNYVETILRSANDAGPHSITWRPSHSGKAVYFVVLQTENIYRVKKVMI